ncbi:MAG: hypothetical protein AB1Z98_31775 [Nannocystaceae bacterium]
MSRLALSLALGSLFALAGCPGDDDGSSSGAESASSGTTTNTSSGSTTNGSADSTTSDAPGTTTDAPGTTTDAPGTTTDEPGTTTDEPGTTTDGGSMVCDPDPADDECATCVKTMCCDQLEACDMDGDETAGCVCFQICAEENPGIPGAIMCGTTCGVNPLGAGTPTGELGSCTQANCAVCLG